jgi:hypothetical protein
MALPIDAVEVKKQRVRTGSDLIATAIRLIYRHTLKL